MAKYKVKKVFRDKNTKDVYKVGSIVELTIKRANEVESSLGSSFIERVEENKAKIKRK